MKNVSYTIDEKRTERQFKKVLRKQAFKRRVSAVGRWISDNRNVIVLVGPAAIGLAATVAKLTIGTAKAGVKSINLQKEKKIKDCYCYDRSLGHYWSLRRKLTNSEWTEIDKRKRNGERMADILNDLHVLK